jgi:hypothetical protein
MNRPQSLTEASLDDTTMQTLRALRDQYQAGLITRKEYDAAFQKINLHVGVPCEACFVRTAHAIAPDGRRLCGTCSIAERGIK